MTRAALFLAALLFALGAAACDSGAGLLDLGADAPSADAGVDAPPGDATTD